MGIWNESFMEKTIQETVLRRLNIPFFKYNMQYKTLYRRWEWCFEKSWDNLGVF